MRIERKSDESYMMEYSKTYLAVLESLRDFLSIAKFEASDNYVENRVASFLLALQEYAGSADPLLTAAIKFEVSKRISAGLCCDKAIRAAKADLERENEEVARRRKEIEADMVALTATQEDNFKLRLERIIEQMYAARWTSADGSKLDISRALISQALEVLQGNMTLRDDEDCHACGFVYFARKLLKQILKLRNFEADFPEISSTITELINLSRLK